MLASRLLGRPYCQVFASKATRQFKFYSFSSNNPAATFDPDLDLEEVKKKFRQFPGGAVTLSKDEGTGLAYLCLDHTEKRNALSGKMMAELNDAVGALENLGAGKGLILYGKGDDAFCSGGYLDTVRNIANPEAGYRMSSLMQDSVLRLNRLPIVSVSLLHGQALGGGAELLLSTDFRLFTPSGVCRFVEAKMGVGTGWGGGTFLRRLLGPGKALRLLLTCEKVTAEEALKIGLADYVILEIEEEERLKAADRFLLALVKDHDVSVVRTMKGIIAANSFEEERKVFARSWGGPAQLRALGMNLKHG